MRVGRGAEKPSTIQAVATPRFIVVNPLFWGDSGCRTGHGDSATQGLERSLTVVSAPSQIRKRLRSKFQLRVTRATIEVYTFFWRKCFLNDGAPQPKIVGKKPFLFSQDSRCVPMLCVFFNPEAVFFSQKSVSLGGVLSSQLRNIRGKKWCISIVSCVELRMCGHFIDVPA